MNFSAYYLFSNGNFSTISENESKQYLITQPCRTYRPIVFVSWKEKSNQTEAATQRKVFTLQCEKGSGRLYKCHTHTHISWTQVTKVFSLMCTSYSKIFIQFKGIFIDWTVFMCMFSAVWEMLMKLDIWHFFYASVTTYNFHSL